MSGIEQIAQEIAQGVVKDTARHSPGLVVTDMCSAATGGAEAARSIRDLEGASGRVPMVALTLPAGPPVGLLVGLPVGREDEAVHCAAGVTGTVAGPVDPERLLAAVRRALAMCRQKVPAT